MGDLIQELKRRKVFRVAAVYAVAAWLLIQIVDTTSPLLGLPLIVPQVVLYLLLIFFPVSLILAWAYDISLDGIKKETYPESSAAASKTEAEVKSAPAISNDQTPSQFFIKPCIAVLPFSDLSQEQNQSWFSEGITEEILNKLARNRQLKVVARTSAFALRNKGLDAFEIGQKLNASHILEGSIRTSGMRIRVSTQLVDSVSGALIWSDQYNDELKDVFEVQDQISRSIMEALNLTLIGNDFIGETSSETGKRATVEPEAFKFYLKGRNQLNLLHLEEAITYFDKAVTIDNKFSEAHAALARTHNLQVFMRQASWLEKRDIVNHCIKQSLELDPGQPEALATKASNLFFIERKYAESIRLFANLVKAYPSDTTCISLFRNVMMAIGASDSAVTLATRMVEMDPLSPLARNYRGSLLTCQGKFELARKDLEDAEELGAQLPTMFANIAFLERRPEEIARQLDRIRNLHGEAVYFAYLARVEFLNENPEAVSNALKQIDPKVYVGHLESSFRRYIASDIDGFFDEYSKAVAEPEFTAILYIQSAWGLKCIDPELISSDRYKAMLTAVGLDSNSIAALNIPDLAELLST